MDAEVSGRAEQQQAAIDEFLGVLEHARRGDSWVGRTPEWHGPVVFGGVALAMTIAAACREAPAASRLHSIHAHFLRPVRSGEEVVFTSAVVKAGRTFTLHDVTASQDGKLALTSRCSFTEDTEGYVYDVSGIPAGVPRPEECPGSDELDVDALQWDARWLGPSPLRPDGTREATHRHWFRLLRPLGDDVHLHTALLGYATDWTGLGGRPLDLEGDVDGMISLDHAAWFHRPARVDE